MQISNKKLSLLLVLKVLISKGDNDLDYVYNFYYRNFSSV